MANAQAPDSGPPPRSVQPWTRVPGHQVISRIRGFCQCGARQQARDNANFDDWRIEHLGNAWPILVSRREAEDLESWMVRIADALLEAAAQEQEACRRDGLDEPVPPGGAFPVISEAHMSASDRVEVLEHQLQDVQAKFHRPEDLSTKRLPPPVSPSMSGRT